MIRVHVSAVCRVRDGFTGQPVETAGLLCSLDDQSCRPVCKPGGYLILTDLPAGRHVLVLTAAGFQREQLELTTGGGTEELDVSMKPGPGYPFRQSVTRLELRVRGAEGAAGDSPLWLAWAAGAELVVAQTTAESGADSLRLFCKGQRKLLPIPGRYLLMDGERSEIVSLRALEGETGELSRPLVHAHSRSRTLQPAQCFRTDADGTLRAFFPQPCTVTAFSPPGGQCESLPLQEGDNLREIRI